MRDFAPILKSPDEHRVKINVVARCRDCKLEHREFDLSLQQWRHGVFGWLEKHTGHDCYFVSPKRTIPARFRDWMFEKFGIAPWYLLYGSNSDLKPQLSTVTAFTITAASLATSSGLTVGRQATAISNATVRYADYRNTAKITTGTSPTGGVINIYAIGSLDDGPTWPDAFGATDAGVTVLAAAGPDAFVLLQGLSASATSNLAYPFNRMLTMQEAFGVLPNNFTVFLAHNSGANLHATAGNHVINWQGMYFTNLG